MHCISILECYIEICFCDNSIKHCYDVNLMYDVKGAS